MSTVEAGGGAEADMGEVDIDAIAAMEEVDRGAGPIMAHMDGGDVAMAEPCGGDPLSPRRRGWLGRYVSSMWAPRVMV